MLPALLFALSASPVLVPVYQPVGSFQTVRATEKDLGSVEAVFDGDSGTLFRTPSINPAEIVVKFQRPKTAQHFRFLVADRSRIVIEAADSVEDLDTKKGTFRALLDKQTDRDGQLIASLAKPTTARVFRLYTQRLAGDDYVHVFEWQFARMVPPESLRVEMVPNRPEWKPFDIIASEGVVRAKAWASVGGSELDVSSRVKWLPDGFRRWNDAWQAKKVDKGSQKGSLTAELGDLRAKKEFTIEGYAKTHDRTDVDVLFVEKLPRTNYDAPDLGNGPGWPKEGSEVLWRAHVTSHNRRATVPYRWLLNGREVGSGSVSVQPGKWARVDLKWNWRQRGATLRFEVVPPSWDANKGNNATEFQTNALTLGMWVDQKMWDHFLDNQYKQNPQNESFADWGRYMVDLWNGIMRDARHPGISPNGLTDRIRLDRVVVVPTLALPLNGGLPSNNPDTRDKSVDLAWGFSTEADSKISDYWAVKPHEGSPLKSPPAFLADLALIHELHHARYHIDSYGFDVHAPYIKVELDGKPVVGSLLPEKFVRYQKYPGMMGGDYSKIDLFVAGVWARVAGQRARGGNMNSPSVIGEWLGTDLPKRTKFRFILPDGKPAAGAELLVWHAVGDQANWYGKVYSGEPNLRRKIAQDGTVDFEGVPFPKNLRHTYGEANTVALCIVRHESGDYVHFIEISDMNIAYWLGQKDSAEFEAKLVAPPGFSN